MITQEELEKETKMTFLRGSGPGGQHRNKVESGVRLTHIPTGITVVATKERKQSRNRDIAFERLASRIEDARKPEVPRVATKVPRRKKEKRLQDKKARSQRKQLRQKLEEE